MHCNPAPPHPPPGEIYNVMCPPVGGWLESLALFALLFVAVGTLGLVLGYRAETDDEPSNGGND